jgi:hypothetical protein
MLCHDLAQIRTRHVTPVSLQFAPTATHVIGTIPAWAIRATATSCASLFQVPESVFPKANYHHYWISSIPRLEPP